MTISEAPLIWLPRFLFLVTVLLSLILAAAVLLAPVLHAEETGWWAHLQALFASDLAVRRTAIASAIGLMVTAWLFFRPRTAYADPVKRKHRPPPSNIAGA